MDRIVRRLPGLALAADPVWKASLAARSMEALLLTRGVALALDGSSGAAAGPSC